MFSVICQIYFIYVIHKFNEIFQIYSFMHKRFSIELSILGAFPISMTGKSYKTKFKMLMEDSIQFMSIGRMENI